MGKSIPTEEKHGVVLKKEIAISYKEKKRNVLLPTLLELCLVMVHSLCAIECFITGYQVEIDKKLFFGVAALLNLCFFVSFSLKKGMELCFIGEILAYGVTGYCFREQIASGLAVVVNLVLSKIEHYYGFKFGKYQVVSENQVYDTTIFLLFISTLLIGILVYLIKNRVSVTWLLYITLFLVLSPEYVGIMPDKRCYLGYVVAMFAYVGSRASRQKVDAKGKARQGIMEAKVCLFQIVTGALILAIFLAVFSEEKYNAMTRDQSFKEAVQDFLKDEFNQLVKGNLYTGSVSGGIGFGELGEVDEIKYTKKVKLRLTVPEEKELASSETMYLRGYLGSVYEGNSWSGLSKEASRELKNLEEKYDMASEEYTAAAYYYLLGLKQFSKENCKPLTSALQEKLIEQPAFLEAYNGQSVKMQLEQVSDELCQDITIENVDETYGTVFTPYYAVGSLAEKDGKLSSKEIKNKSEYTWSRAPLMKRYLQLYGGMLDSETMEIDFSEDSYYTYWTEENDLEWSSTDEEEEYSNDLDIYGVSDMREESFLQNKMIDFWKDLLREKNVAEDKLGSSIVEYEDSVLSGTTWGEKDADSYAKVLRNATKFYTRQQEYEEFVNKTYTQISEEEKNILLDVLEDEWVSYDGDVKDLKEDILLVKEYLHQQTAYSLNPGKLPEGKDFVNYFLFENKIGYCSHYASAATLFFRSMGIPARYVEGYLANSTKFDYATSQQGKKTVDLTDENAHAWVEVYISGYGWLPVEVTPGYGQGERGTASEPTKEVKSTNTPQTSKPVPTAASNVTASQTSSSHKSFDFDEIKPILQGISIVLVVVAIIVGRRKWILVWRRKQEQNPDFNVRAAFYYRRIEMLLVQKKERKQGGSLRNKIQEETMEAEHITEKEWKQLLLVMNKYAFSKAGISAEELELIFDLYKKVVENIYQNSSRLKRLYYKYIKVV